MLIMAKVPKSLADMSAKAFTDISAKIESDFLNKKILKILRNFSLPNKNLYFLSGEGFSPTLTDMSIKNVSSLFRRYPLPIIHAVTGGPPLGSSSDASYISQEKNKYKVSDDRHRYKVLSLLHG